MFREGCATAGLDWRMEVTDGRAGRHEGVVLVADPGVGHANRGPTDGRRRPRLVAGRGPTGSRFEPRISRFRCSCCTSARPFGTSYITGQLALRCLPLVSRSWRTSWMLPAAIADKLLNLSGLPETNL